MNSVLPLILFTLAIITACFYVFHKFRTIKGFSFARFFPFESNGNSSEIKISLFSIVIFTTCSVFFYLNIYSINFTNSYVLLATISALLICGLFLGLNVINLVNLKAHFLLFSLLAALVTTQSVVMGFHSINAYNIDGNNWLFIVLAVLFFAKAGIELLLVSPLFKFSFLMEVNKEEDIAKKPPFIRLAFYEWLYFLLFILNSFLLLVEKSV